MAEDAIDQAVAAGGLHSGPCATRTLPLLGAASYYPALFTEVSCLCLLVCTMSRLLFVHVCVSSTSIRFFMPR